MDVAAVETDVQWQVRTGQRLPVSLAAIDEAAPLVTEFVLQALGHGVGLSSDRRGVQGPAQRQEFSQQRGGDPGRGQSSEAGLQIAQLGHAALR